MAQSDDPHREAPVYNIRAVSRLTGIPADNLRRWESRYAIITPQRTESGYRIYSQRDVDIINWLKGKLDEGLSISRACEMLRHLGGDPDRLARQPTSASQLQAGGTRPTPANAVRSFDALRADLMAAFRAVDEQRASATLTDALSLYSPEDVCMQILQPALFEIGDAWLHGEISVAVEHFAAAFVRTRLSNLFHASYFNPYGPFVLVACAPNELHELGAMFLALFLRRAGYKVIYLGQSVPLESLEGLIEALRPQAVCVSSTRAETAARLYTLRDFLGTLKTRRGRAPLLAYGGQVFNRYPHITERLGGAYLGEDATVAVCRLDEELNR